MDIKEIFDKLRDEVRELLGDPRSNNVDHTAVHAAIDKAHEAATPTEEPAKQTGNVVVVPATATGEQSGSGAE